MNPIYEPFSALYPEEVEKMREYETRYTVNSLI